MISARYRRYENPHWAFREKKKGLSQVESALIAAGAGYVWDSYLCPMYQTTDTSTPVVSNGDPIGRIDEYFAGSANLLQGTAGSRPSYLEATKAIQLAGDWLEVTGLSVDLDAGVNVLIHCQSDKTTSSGSNEMYFSGRQTSGSANRPVLFVPSGTTNLQQPPMPTGTNVVWTSGLSTSYRTLRLQSIPDGGASSAKIFENGVEKAANTNNVGTFTLNAFTLGATLGGGTPFSDLKVTFIGVFPVASVSEAQVAAIDAALVAERN